MIATTSLIYAVIVTFHPDRSKLLGLVNSLLPQVESLVIIDNGSSSEGIKIVQELVDQYSLDLLLLGENVGIAAAQNIGIFRARELRSKYVIFFDQDSKPNSNMVSELMGALQKKDRLGIRVASVGPNFYVNTHPNLKPFRLLNGFFVNRIGCNELRDVVPVSYLISSGSLIPMSTLDSVGGMREDLFIDYVDIEWGLRASQKGFLSFGVCSALMEHDLGDSPLYFFGISITNHSPLRHYYLFRNAVWLYRQEYLPLQWRIGDAWRLLLKYVFYSLYGKPRLAHIKMMSKGMWHGLTGQLGKYK